MVITLTLALKLPTMKKLAIVLFAAISLPVVGQPTWSGDIAAIAYKNCTSCHNPQSIAPFSMMDYYSVRAWAGKISTNVQNGEMPPWKPDTAFQRFVHERVLTAAEKSKLLDWADNGTPSGNLSQAPAPPVYPPGATLGIPDLKVTMPSYTSKATANKDDYICLAIPSGLTKTRKIKAVEVVPGNRNIVHHTLVFIDPSGQYQSDTIGGDCGGPSSGKMVTGYAPGGQPTIFPNGGSFKTGMTMPANSNIILALHYPEGSAGQKDSTSVYFYFYDENETGVRELGTAPLLENWGFCIDANTLQTVDDWYPSSTGGVNQDYSLLSIFPHCHLLGHSMESYALNANNDTTPLIKIPHWDFEWQDFYFFKNIVKLEQGSRLYGKALYDNRAANPHNPFSPPQRICAGLNTTDEMFIFYFHYMPYQPGDELVNIDSLMTNSVGLGDYALRQQVPVEVWPVPTSGEVSFSYHLQNQAFVNLYVYDSRGGLVKKLVNGQQASGLQKVEWDGLDDSGAKAAAGLYFYSLKVGEAVSAGQVVLQNTDR